MEKAKSIKMLSCFVAVAIAICLLIVFVNTSCNQGEKQSVEEVNIKNCIHYCPVKNGNWSLK